jgi:hypothetical protein
MVGDQAADQAAKSLKKGGKNHHFWNSSIAFFVVLLCL